MINSCRKICVGWWTGCSESGGGVFGFPSLSLSDGLEQQHRPGWDVGVGRCGAFPQVRPVLWAMSWLDTGCFEELPNKLATLGAVIYWLMPGRRRREAEFGDDMALFGR